MATYHYLCFVILFAGSSLGVPQKYPKDDPQRLDTINSVFQHELAKMAIASLESVLSLANVSTALKDIQRDLNDASLQLGKITVSFKTGNYFLLSIFWEFANLRERLKILVNILVRLRDLGVC